MKHIKYLRRGNRYAGSVGYGKFGIPMAAPSSVAHPLTLGQQRELLKNLLIGYRELFLRNIRKINEDYEKEFARIREDFEPVLGQYYLDHNEFDPSIIEGINADRLGWLAMNKVKYDILVSALDAKRNVTVRTVSRERAQNFNCARRDYPKRWWQSRHSYLGNVCPDCGREWIFRTAYINCSHQPANVSYTTEEGDEISNTFQIGGY